MNEQLLKDKYQVSLVEDLATSSAEVVTGEQNVREAWFSSKDSRYPQRQRKLHGELLILWWEKYHVFNVLK